MLLKVIKNFLFFLNVCITLFPNRTTLGSRVNNLKRCYKATLSAVFFTIFIMPCLNLYSFDYNRMDISLMNLLDSLSINYKGFDIKLKGISIGEMYDDNVTFDKENKKEDFITILGIGMSAKYEGKTKTLELTANLGNQTYARNSDFDNTTQDIAINFKNEFSEYDRMTLTNTFTHTDAPIFFRDDFFRPQQGRRKGSFDYFKNRFHADYSRDVFKQMSVTFKYDNDIDTFSGIDIEDSMLNRVGLESNYSITPDTTFLFLYDFTNRMFQEGSDASINTVAAGIRQYITRKIYFDGKIGLSFIDTFNDESLIRPVPEAAVSYQIDDLTLARLSFTKKIDTNPYDANISDNWRATAAVTQQLSERFRCSLSIFYGDRESLSFDYNQKLLGSRALFTYDINKNLKGNLDYTFSDADSNIDTAGYIKNTVFLGLTAEF